MIRKKNWKIKCQNFAGANTLSETKVAGQRLSSSQLFSTLVATLLLLGEKISVDNRL